MCRVGGGGGLGGGRGLLAYPVTAKSNNTTQVVSLRFLVITEGSLTTLVCEFYPEGSF